MNPTTDTSTEVIPASEARPAPYFGGAEAIGSDDLALPRLNVAHAVTAAVQDGLVPAGALFVSYEAADPEPKILYRPGEEDGVTIHVLGTRKVWAYRNAEDDRFVIVDRPHDMALPPVEEAQDAQAGYEFAVLIPCHDLRLPCSWLVKSSAMACGKRILTEVARAEVPIWTMAFSLSTAQRSNDMGRWYVPVAVVTKANPEHVEAAAQVAALLGVPGA
jgi:hypothetical protein